MPSDDDDDDDDPWTVAEMYQYLGTFCCGSSESTCGAYDEYPDRDGFATCLDDCDTTIVSNPDAVWPNDPYTLEMCSTDCYSDCDGE